MIIRPHSLLRCLYSGVTSWFIQLLQKQIDMPLINISYDGRVSSPEKVMVQSNYSGVYLITFWVLDSVAQAEQAYDPVTDIALWKVKSLKTSPHV
jgi:hypothetical protein